VLAFKRNVCGSNDVRGDMKETGYEGADMRKLLRAQ
jgi:hypothetical protein